MSEHDLKNKVHELLKRIKRDGHRVWWFKAHGGPFQRRTIDYFITVWPEGFEYGINIALELKSPSEKAEPTATQARELANMRWAGWITMCMNDYEATAAMLMCAVRGDLPVLNRNVKPWRPTETQ